MRSFLKILAIVVGALVALLIVGIIVLYLVVDPNDFKAPIEKVVAEKTGRTLKFEGDLSLTVFPWLGVALGPVSLSNAPGFGDKPMLTMQHAAVSVKILPLLSKQVEISTLSVDGLNVNLARKADGTTNWDDLVAKGKAETAAPEAAAPEAEKPSGEAAMPIALRVGGVEIVKANVVWDDQQAGQHIALSDLNVSLGEVAEGDPVDFKVSLALDSAKPQVRVVPVVSGTLTADLKARRYALSNLKLNVEATGEAVVAQTAKLSVALGEATADETAKVYAFKNLTVDVSAEGGKLPMDSVALALSAPSLDLNQTDGKLDLPQLSLDLTAKGDKLPGKEVKGKLAAKVAANLKAGTANLSDLALTLRDLTLTGDLTAKGLNTEPEVSGALNLAAFNPKKLLNDLGLPPVETADPAALTKLAASLALTGSKNAAQVKDIKLTLDDTTITGQAGITDFEHPAYLFSFVVDDLDADRYLPPAKPEEAKAEKPKAEEKPAEPAKKPDYAPLRQLTAKGDLSVGKLKIRNLKLENLKFALNAKDGVITVDPLSADLYQGRVANNMVFDVRGDLPAFKEKTDLTDVQAGPLLADLTGKERLTGTTKLNLDISGQGDTGPEIKRTLSGNAAFAFTNGAIKGVNIAKMIRDAKDILAGKKPTADENEATDFAELSGTLKMDKGLVTNNDLSLKSPLLRVTGEGKVDLPSDSVDYLVTAAVVGTLKGQGGESLTSLKNIPIPIRVTGSTVAPKFTLDPKALAEAIAKGAVGDVKAITGTVEEKAKGLLGIGGKKSSDTTSTPATPTEKPSSPMDIFKKLTK